MLPNPLPLKYAIVMAEDIRENAMAGGTPARLRGLDANGNSISPTLAEVTSAMPVATMEKKGLVSAGQGIVEYRLEAESYVDIGPINYGIYLLVSEQSVGSSVLFQLSYAMADFKILLDPSNIIKSVFNIEQTKEGSKTIRVTNLRSSFQRFSINRL